MMNLQSSPDNIFDIPLLVQESTWPAQIGISARVEQGAG